MGERWDRARVLALAPDASSQRAAQSLTSGRAWAASGASPGASAGAGTGAGQAALWGECRGSASAPYLTVIDLSGPAYRCSCPSRKFPCKHGLGLLLLFAKDQGAFKAAAEPGWVADWIAGRAERAEKKVDKAKADDELIQTVLKGKKPEKPPNMPAFEERGITSDQAKALVGYVKSLK